MQIKFINTDTLDSTIVNIKGGTLEEILIEAENTIKGFNKTIISQNGDLMKFNNFIGDILYHGIPKAEQRKGRNPLDWTDKINKFNEHYTESITAKELAVKSGLSLSNVYYISAMINRKLKAGKRGRRSTK